MKLLLYGINYTPELTGIGKYTGEMAVWLASRGHDVRVVTAPPYYPEWKVSNAHARWRYCYEIQEGVQIWRCPLYVPAKPSGMKRLVHLASFALTSFPMMLRHSFWRPEVVWVVEPALMCAPGALLTARLSSAKTWLHVQDFEVDAAFDMGIVKAGWLKFLVLGVERWLMRHFDRVSTISTGMLGKLHSKRVFQNTTVLFPNWVNLESISPDEAVGQSMRAELGLTDQARVALYSGNLGEKQGLEYVVDAARLLKGTDLIFVICGDGAVKPRLQRMAEGLPNIRWLPLQPVEKLHALLNMPDVHLLPQRKNVADLVMPSKLTGIFASGRPVIAMAEPGTTVYDAVHGRGMVVPPEDARALASALEQLLADNDACDRLGAAGRKFAVDTLCQEAILSRFENQLLELK